MVKTKQAPKSKAAKKAKQKLVDYYPNRMTVAVSVLAGTSLVLLYLLFTMSW